MDQNPYIWGRNLLANRIFDCPVIYLEPYVANSEEFFNHFKLGEYLGTQEYLGRQRKNIYQEYADSVVDGILSHYSEFQ